MKNNYFLSQPHQPFFVLSFINAIVFMLLFMLSYNGIITITIDTAFFHSYSLIYLFFTPAFFAFLLTTFPRFLSSQPIEKNKYIGLFLLLSIGSIIFLIGSFTSNLISKIGMTTISLSYIYGVFLLYSIHQKSDMPNKHDTYWILIGFLFGFIANIIFYISSSLGIEIAIYLYLFVLGFSVAQRMIPFFSQCMITRNKSFMRNIVLLLLFHIILEMIQNNLSYISDIILGIYIGKELVKWKLPLTVYNPMLNILHISLLWVPVSFLVGSISKAISTYNNSYFISLDIHILMLGFLFTVLIGFGTRVTLGHSQNQMYANNLTISLFILTQIVVLVRIIVSIVASLGYDFILIFNISIVIWLLMFSIWIILFFKVLVFGKRLN